MEHYTDEKIYDMLRSLSIEELRKVQSEYRNRPTASRSLITACEIAIAEKQEESEEKAFVDIVNRHKNTPGDAATPPQGNETRQPVLKRPDSSAL